MQITYYGKNLTVTPAMQQCVAEKLSTLERFSKETGKAHVTVEMNRHHRHGDIFTIHVLLDLVGTPLVAEESAGDFYACVDFIENRLRRQVTRHYDRHRTLSRSMRRFLFPRTLALESGRRIRSFNRKQQRQLRLLLNKILRK